MNVEFYNEDNFIIAKLNGEIDHHIAKFVREDIDLFVLKNNPQKLYLDFSKVTFMDSSGIGLILGRYQLMKSRNGIMKVINVPSNIEKLIILGGLGQLNLIEKKEVKQ